MRSVAKTINAEASRIPGLAIRTIADQSSTKQRRNFNIIVAIRQMETESCISDCEVGITAVDGVAGETRIITEVLPMRPTVDTFAICPPQPWDAYAIANVEF